MVIMLRVLVTGGTGLLGYNLVRELADRGFKIYATYHKTKPIETLDISWIQVDLEDLDGLVKTLAELSPDITIHAAAYTDVDGCELNKDLAYRINYIATRTIASIAKKKSFRLIYISTDYVFDGVKGFYREDDTPNPVNFYGLSKLLGEIAVSSVLGDKSLIVRVSGLYGHSPVGKKNFGVIALERLAKSEIVNAFYDQYLSPTYVYSLAKLLVRVIERDLSGVIHIAGERVSRYEFALMLANTLGVDKSLVKPVSIETAKLVARRPRDSSLDTSLARRHSLTLPPIEECIKHFVESYKREIEG